jgi:hypothetical protein
MLLAKRSARACALVQGVYSPRAGWTPAFGAKGTTFARFEAGPDAVEPRQKAIRKSQISHITFIRPSRWFARLLLVGCCLRPAIERRGLRLFLRLRGHRLARQLFSGQQSAEEVSCGNWKSLVNNFAKPGFPAMKTELRDRCSPPNGHTNAKASRSIGKTSRHIPNEATVLADLEIDGFAIIPNIFSGEALSELQKQHKKYWEAFKKSSVANRNGVGSFRGSTVLFLEKGRYDLELDFGIFRSRRLLQNNRIINITKKMLKSNYISYAGSLPSLPNSKDGSWHRDVYSLFGDEALETTLPVFYVTVLIPLVDIDANNGATEFIVGSHKGSKSGKRIVVQTKAGSAIICNGMVYHRGRANKSHKERHMLYIVYCKKWYNDYT